MPRLFRYVGPIPLDLEREGKKLSLMPGETVDLTGKEDLIAMAQAMIPSGEFQDHSTPDAKPSRKEPVKPLPAFPPDDFHVEPATVRPLTDKSRRK